MNEELVTLHLDAQVWQNVEAAFPYAKDSPRPALAFLLGLAIGTLLKMKADDAKSQRAE